MTYGDRYLELCREYDEYINGYILELCAKDSLEVDIGMLDKLSEGSKIKKSILREFVAYMKGNGIKITDQYNGLNSK